MFRTKTIYNSEIYYKMNIQLGIQCTLFCLNLIWIEFTWTFQFELSFSSHLRHKLFTDFTNMFLSDVQLLFFKIVIQELGVRCLTFDMSLNDHTITKRKWLSLNLCKTCWMGDNMVIIRISHIYSSNQYKFVWNIWNKYNCVSYKRQIEIW